jgi:hypothetical protein
MIVAILDKEDPNTGLVERQPLPIITAPWEWDLVGQAMME